MIVPLAQEVVTADEFERLPDRDRYELVDGRLVEMPEMGLESTWVAGQVYTAMDVFNKTHRLGWVFPSEGEFAFFPDRPNYIRKPDAAFIRYGRLEGERLPRGRCRLAPDLAVEVTYQRTQVGAFEVKFVVVSPVDD